MLCALYIDVYTIDKQRLQILENGIMKLRTILATAILAATASSANAVILVDDWDLDVSSLFGASAAIDPSQYHVIDVSEMTFLAVGTSTTIDADGNGIPSVGETFVTSAGGVIESFRRPVSGANISPAVYETTGVGGLEGWSLTFTFEVGGTFTSVDTSDANFVHVGPGGSPASGVLTFYVNNNTVAGGVDVAGNTNISTVNPIATFDVKPGDGGVFSFLTGDGSDDTTFTLTSAAAGFWTDKNGNDFNDLLLASSGGDVLLGLADGNFDSAAGGTAFDFNPSGYNCGTQTATSFCFSENGGFILVPVPGSLALLSLGLIGLARRRSA